MSDDVLPTEDEIRDAAISYSAIASEAEWDSWLAAHDAEVEERAFARSDAIYQRTIDGLCEARDQFKANAARALSDQQLDAAVGRALFENKNYPDWLQMKVLGRDMSTLRKAIVESLTLAQIAAATTAEEDGS